MIIKQIDGLVINPKACKSLAERILKNKPEGTIILVSYWNYNNYFYKKKDDLIELSNKELEALNKLYTFNKKVNIKDINKG